ncbi:uncharacterized protein FIESC28_06193 [Fusarium coffeatum]|uniref:VIT domain-containing protein n=1 Tax=Fusarium coffeatum TaxID=231269 RepID=A0A366RLY4_9HYPO|nr:uncharacterized protein FIESC28_06193 [Fusarium coffeatum]RBR18127.1 hypothetical protein FIESC28_06193 [Fusarium coffeatum]
MSSRHVPTKRINSGIRFSIPHESERAPPDGPLLGPRFRKSNIIRKGDEQGSFDKSSVQTLGSCVAMSVNHDAYGDQRALPTAESSGNGTLRKEEDVTQCLPILQVSLTATIHGILAHTEIIQSFHNSSDIAIKEAKHTFPLYDGAVITEFECTIGDERRIRGVVKPKQQAREDFEEAVHEQAKAAALLEEHTPEIFETSLGNIPPKTSVEVKIVYIQELKVVLMETKATEGIALVIPTSIAPRYGRSQLAWQPESQLPKDRLDITVRVLNDGRVNPRGCEEESGHIVYDEGSKLMEPPRPSGRIGAPESLREYHVWHHHSKTPVLTKDFVFVVQATKGQEIRSRAVYSPPDDSGLAAMMVTIRPNELFRDAIVPQSFSGEILFLIDRSGSMIAGVGGYPYSRHTTKIDVMRQAMLLAVSGLPKTCYFNVISWGSETWALWEESRQHSPENIIEAKDYISHIRADMGGTDLLRALKASVQHRHHKLQSTQIIVVTDGELQPKIPMEFVWKTRQSLQNRVRFFALGIGGTVPHALIESIAELGGGYGDVVDIIENPRWHERLNRLVKAALEPDSWNCIANIGDGFKQHSLADYDELDTRKTSDTQPDIPYFQAPYTIVALHPFKFTTIFFLIDTKGRGPIPKEVIITTTTPGAKERTYRLPVESVPDKDGTMHRLAAKATLMDLENRVGREPSVTPRVEENAQTLGARYSITSKWTSFVAIPQDESDTTTEGNMIEHYKTLLDSMDINDLLTGAESDSDGFEAAGTGSSWSCANDNPIFSFPNRKHFRGWDSDEDDSGGIPTIFFPDEQSFSVSRSYDRCSKEIDYLGNQSESWKPQMPKSNKATVSKPKAARYTRRDVNIMSSATTLPQSRDPLNWEITVSNQNGQGLFELPRSAKEKLRFHFCSNTSLALGIKLDKPFLREDEETSIEVISDTLMIIKYYQTHLSHIEDIWDLMMTRAQDAVTDFIGEKAADLCGDLLADSMMHAHYIAATGVKSSQGEGSTGTATCPMCQIPWQTSRRFFCPFDHDSDTLDVFEEWIDFWKHQQQHKHLVCPMEGVQAE